MSTLQKQSVPRKIICEICHIKTSSTGDQKRRFMAKFPLNADRCKQWVAATGNEDLVYVPIEKLHQLKFICSEHFRPNDFTKKKTRLKRKAVPFINIATKPLTDDMLKDFPLHVANNERTSCSIYLDHNYCSHTNTQKPSTSAPEATPTYVPKRKLEPSTLSTENTSANDSKQKRLSSPNSSTSSTENTYANDFQQKGLSSPKPSTSSTEIPKRENLEITPQKRKLINKLKKSQTKIKELQKQVDQMEKFLSPVLKSLISSTVNNQNRKPHGKRWTKLNKSVALAIYKKSPEAYRYLSNLLPMPSVRTLQIVLQNMKVEPGVDASIVGI